MKNSTLVLKMSSILLIVSLIMIGCASQKLSKREKIDSEKQAPTIIQGTKVEDSTSTKNKKNEYDELTQKEKDQLDKIKSTINENLIYNIEFSKTNPDKGQIKYDFNNDNKIDSLNYLTELMDNPSDIIKKCKIDINGFTLERETNADEIVSMGIFDADKNDNYIEIFIVYGYLRGGTPEIYRLTDKGIEKIADIDGGIVATSGDGKIYYWGGNLFEEAFNTNLVLTYYDINKKEYIETEQIVGKTITAKFDCILYKTKEAVLDGAPVTEEDKIKMSKGKIVKIVKSGEKFKVLSVSDGIKIKTNDGKIGWIGGFHMVWD